MNAVENDIEFLVEKELKKANEKFPMFASAHEGYAVIKEEIEEAEQELHEIKNSLDMLWHNIKINDSDWQNEFDIQIKAQCKNLACEAVQVAAMAQKFIDSLEGK